VRNFLLETFGTRGPDQAAGATVTVRELLDRRAATLDSAYANDPEMRGELSGVLAEAYERLGLYNSAEPLARRALDDQRAVHGPVAPDVATALDALGWIQRQRGQVQQAEQTLTEAVKVGREAFAPEGDGRLARALNDLGAVKEARGDYDGAEAAYRESLDMRHRLQGDNDVDDGIAVTTSNLAVLLYRRGDLEGAAKMMQSAVETLTRLLGADHDRTIIAEGNLAAIHAVQGDHEGAAAIYRKILERDRRVLGPRHPQVAYALTAYANELLRLHRSAEAEPLLREALDINREAFGPSHERVEASLRVLGDAVDANGRPREALGDYQEAMGIVRETLGPKHDEVAVLHQRIGNVHAETGSTRQAEADYRAAIAGFEFAHGPKHYLTVDATLSLAELYLDTDRVSAARRVLDGIAPVVSGLGPSFSELKGRYAKDSTRAG